MTHEIGAVLKGIVWSADHAWIRPTEVCFELDIGSGDWLFIVGSDAGLDYVIRFSDGSVAYSQDYYGTFEIALRDALCRVFGVPEVRV